MFSKEIQLSRTLILVRSLKLFPECRTAKLFCLGADKIRYSSNYHLTRYFCQNSQKKSRNQKSEIYVISCDESWNDLNQKCQMDSVVRYWDSSQGFPQVLRTWREGGGGQLFKI